MNKLLIVVALLGFNMGMVVPAWASDVKGTDLRLHEVPQASQTSKALPSTSETSPDDDDMPVPMPK